MVDMTYQKMCPLFYPGCRNYMWNKLIKRELYNGIVFEDCISMSDVQVMYKIFDKAVKVYQVKASLVYYRRHSDSMSNSSRYLLSYWKYRIEVMLDELTFVYDKYDISKFICRRTMESELYKLRTRATTSEYEELYSHNKDRIEHILYDFYECNFDVDLVVPYVDNRDPVWQKSYMGLTNCKDFLNNPRFDNPGLFEYFSVLGRFFSLMHGPAQAFSLDFEELFVSVRRNKAACHTKIRLLPADPGAVPSSMR